MSQRIEIDPVTRLEGHLAVRLEVDAKQVTAAYSSGEMFRGFEAILRGRSPMDAQQITQRICGVCPISHGITSCLAQEQAYGIQPPTNGRLLRNLILGANYIQSHLVHFYQLSALDFIDITAILAYQGRDAAMLNLKSWVKNQIEAKAVFPAAPFLPRYDGRYVEDAEINLGAIKHYLDALEMRALAHQAVALFGGKAPHATCLVPGGVTEHVTVQNILACQAILEKLQGFIDNIYLPDVVAVAQTFPEYFGIGRGCGNFLAYGVFPEDESDKEMLFPAGVIRSGKLEGFDAARITEDVGHSLFSSPSGLSPAEGKTVPAPGKSGAYSWVKAPRYDGMVCEVGPLARMLVAYQKGQPQAKSMIDSLLSRLGAQPEALLSVLGRHAARALECKIVADRCAAWVDQLVPGQPTCTDFTVPDNGAGIGLSEAPRGALGHWITIQNHKIANYQCVVPTTWNCSPRDDQDRPGPVEQALAGLQLADPENPLEAARVIRSFDPCLACAVH